MDGEPDPVIWVDEDMKRCAPTHSKARRCTYNKEFELYVVDKPKIREAKSIFEKPEG